MFGGYGFEVLYRPFYSLWALGFEAYDVKQRAYKQNFDFIDYETATGHATFYLTEPKQVFYLSLSEENILPRILE